jgi:hypothetical protein
VARLPRHYLLPVIARSDATKQSMQMDRHALVPRARDDKRERGTPGRATALPKNLRYLGGRH